MRSDLYSKMMRAESTAIQFNNDADAENYTLVNPEAIAVVIKDGVVVTTYYGNDFNVGKYYGSDFGVDE